MKYKFILITLLCATALCACRDISNDRLESELHEQQEAKNRWEAIAFVLGIGCTAVLFIGASMGSKARKDAESRE